MKRLVILLLICTALNSSLKAQELNCQVTLITDARMELTTVEKEILEQLKQTIFEFMNNTKWTKDKFKVEERINCQLQLQINSIPSPGTYNGSLQVQASRPVINSNYNSSYFNFQDDDIEFTYSRNALLAYAPNQFRDNLTSILAFYAYYILGMDYDSFSLKGGTNHFNEAQSIVNNAQTAAGKGWKSSETGKRNRYWLIDNTLQQLFEPLRESIYEYHRKGLDQLLTDKATAIKNMNAAMEKIIKVSTVRPNTINIQTYCRTKLPELKIIFGDAAQAEKIELVNTMKKLDPVNSSRYDEILN